MFNRLIYLVALFFLSSLAFPPSYAHDSSKPAMSVKASFEYGVQKKNSFVPVFLDKAEIHASPDQAAPILDQLCVGDVVQILSDITKLDDNARDLATNRKVQAMTVNGYSDYWYRVRCPLSGKMGYVWGGALSKAALELSGSRLFIFGLIGRGKDSIGERIGIAKLLSGGKVTSAISFKVEETDLDGKNDFCQYTIAGKLLPSKGFSGNLQLISIKFIYEACDYLNSEFLLVALGNKLTYGFVSYRGGSEDGAYDYRYILPADKYGIANKIIEIDTASRVKPKKVIYLWEGSRFKRL